jgi:putative ABC transport system substrate-binding protein
MVRLLGCCGRRGQAQDGTHPQLLTRSGGKQARNLAAQQDPDLMLADPLSCRPWQGQYMQFAHLKRREAIALLGGAVAAWPMAARAQQPKLPTIGFLGASTPSGWGVWVAAFQKRLRELGWIEGRTVAVEYRWAEGRSERYAEIAAEFVRLKVDTIVTVGSAVLAAKQVTSAIPIVFAVAVDPLGSGMVTSLARPGGNVTGLSVQATDLVGKRLEILRELVPGLRRLAIIGNVGYPAAALEMGQVELTAGTLGLDNTRLEIRRAEDIAPVFDALKSRADALYVCADALVNANRLRINVLALGARLPTMHAERENVEPGGLVSYGPVYVELWGRAAELVDKILRGAKPADIPVEQPAKFELVINLTTAKALGLTISETFLLRANEVIE